MKILNSFDIKILRELQHNADISMQELDDKVGLSHTPCRRRVKRVEEGGVGCQCLRTFALRRVKYTTEYPLDSMTTEQHGVSLSSLQPFRGGSNGQHHQSWH